MPIGCCNEFRDTLDGVGDIRLSGRRRAHPVDGRLRAGDQDRAWSGSGPAWVTWPPPISGARLAVAEVAGSGLRVSGRNEDAARLARAATVRAQGQGSCCPRPTPPASRRHERCSTARPRRWLTLGELDDRSDPTEILRLAGA